jgi:hypothetical protein
MHVLTIFTKFTLGDLVRFDSKDGKGAGKIFAITVHWDKSIDYLVEIDMGDYSDLLPGIVDADITEQLNNGEIAAKRAITIVSKYSYGDVVRFDSINGNGTGMVTSIMVDWEKCISYYIKIDDGRHPDPQPGILESEVLGMVAADEISNR